MKLHLTTLAHAALAALIGLAYVALTWTAEHLLGYRDSDPE